LTDVRLQVGPIVRAALRNRRTFVSLILEVAVGISVVIYALAIGAWFWSTATQPTGLDEENLLVMMVEHEPDRSDPNQEIRALATLPGVREVASIVREPFMRRNFHEALRAADPPFRSALGASVEGSDQLVDALGLELLAGRRFTASDRDAVGEHSVLVTEPLAERLFPGQVAVGRRILSGSRPEPLIIAGVVARGSIEDHFFPDAEQIVFRLSPPPLGRRAFYLLRVDPAARSSAPLAAARLLQARDPDLVAQAESMATLRASKMRSPQRAFFVTLALIAIVVLVVLTGTIAMMAFLVRDRQRQIGIRRALGARRIDIVCYFLVENWLITSGGLLLGISLSYALSPLVRRAAPALTLEIRWVLTGMALFWVAGLGAALLPALRAASIAPSVASRAA
jgi:putative ABC transport system permease protein